MRYQHASEIRSDLKRLQRDSGSSRRPAAQSQESKEAQAAEGVVIWTWCRPLGTDWRAVQSSSPQVTASGSSISAVAREHKFGLGAVIAVDLVLLAAGGFGIYSLLNRSSPSPFQNFTITQMTNTGRLKRLRYPPTASTS